MDRRRQSENSGRGAGVHQYESLHVLHNYGVSAQNMNNARVGLSKALNSTARWAPRIVNPVDVNGEGTV